MSIDKALKAKNSGVFIENLQAAFLKRSPQEILEAVQKAPSLKWAAEMEVKKLGLMTWCDEKYTEELISKINQCIDSKEYRSAGIGCLYLFGVGKPELAIELSEKAFESIEASSDYEFNATSLLSVLISSTVEWEGSPSGKFYIKIDADYLGSTIASVADDLKASESLYTEQYIVEFSTGLARAGMPDKATLLMKEFINTIDDYSEIESFIYNLTSTIEGLPSDLRSMEAVNSEFVTNEFVTICLEKAKTHAKKSDGDALTELSEYVSEFNS